MTCTVALAVCVLREDIDKELITSCFETARSVCIAIQWVPDDVGKAVPAWNHSIVSIPVNHGVDDGSNSLLPSHNVDVVESHAKQCETRHPKSPDQR